MGAFASRRGKYRRSAAMKKRAKPQVCAALLFKRGAAAVPTFFGVILVKRLSGLPGWFRSCSP
eukprot:15140109-Alexandrium_andersonii.AAC.1